MGDTRGGNKDNGGVPIGDIQFYEAIIPPLDDGVYTVHATQTLTNLPGKDPTINPVTFEFSVRGPRFKLNPSDTFSVFPPSSPPTPYEGQIPHVVVSRRTLPWERLLAPGQPRSTPWLALLTVSEEDTGGIPKVASGTVRDLIAVAGGGKRPATIGGSALKASDLDAGESLDDPCNYVDLPAALFATLAPRLDDVPLLVHARGVNTGNKPIEGIVANGVYSVIVGNRVSHASALNGAFLVSLERFQDLLTGQVPAGILSVRLVVLYSWLFRMGGEDPFDTLMSAAHSGLLAVDSPATTEERIGAQCIRKPMTISPPVPGSPTFPDDTVSYALQSGYAALSHDLRDGSRAFSWYRGPLIPYQLGLVLNSDSSIPMFRNADELLRYNPESGLFDTTYAAAFQLGRLLALQNETFLSTLRTYFHEIKGHSLRLATRKALVATGRIPLDLPAAIPDLLRRGVVLDATVHWLAANAIRTLNAVATKGSGGDPQDGTIDDRTGSGTGTRFSRLHGLLSDETYRAELLASAPPPPETVLQWLADLVLLTGVPFEYLVPDERMLPQESLRFFFVDENWIERLLDGALSVVGRTKLDQLLGDVLRALVRRPVLDSAVASVRPRLLGTRSAATEPEKLNWPLTGFLARSVVVDHWKGIVIENSSRDNPRDSLTTLRLDRPAQGVLLGLYNGSLGSITFKHPPESLHFGIDGQEDSPRTWQQKLRRLDTGLYESGKVEIKFHDQGQQVIDVGATRSEMQAALVEKPARFTSAELAIEMIESPKSVTFEMLYP